jgi:hypothetical protein
MTPKKSMKKFLITIPFLFLAAACNKQTAQVQPVQNQQVQTSQPTQQQPQATSTGETANWKIYKNDKYGFEFKYPSGWYFKFEQNQWQHSYDIYRYGNFAAYLTRSPDEDFYMVFEGFNEGLDNLLKEPDYFWGSKENIQNKETVTIGNQTFEKITWKFPQESPEDVLYIQNQSKTITMQLEVPPYDQQDFMDVLSTFKFTNQTSDWKTYNNSQKDFSIQYPLGWLVKENGNLVDLYGPNADLGSVDIKYYPSFNNLPLNPATNKPYDNFEQYVMDPHFFKNQKLISLNSGTAESAVSVLDTATHVMLVGGNGHFYEVSYMPRYNQTLEQLEQIVQTFKFNS